MRQTTPMHHNVLDSTMFEGQQGCYYSAKQTRQKIGQMNISQSMQANFNDVPLEQASDNDDSEPIPKTRGFSRSKATSALFDGERFHISLDSNALPIGDHRAHLASYLGTLARKGNLAPLTYSDWRTIPSQNKDDMWKLVQSKFVIDPIGKKFVLASIGDKWRNFKARLKRKYYYPYVNNREILKKTPPRVVKAQWEHLIKHWSSEGKARSEKNKISRGKYKMVHIAGSKPFNQIYDDEVMKK